MHVCNATWKQSKDGTTMVFCSGVKDTTCLHETAETWLFSHDFHSFWRKSRTIARVSDSEILRLC
jgi:hypothetical protein